MSLDRYHQLIDDGAFTPNDHVELIHGMVLEKMSKNPPHVISLILLMRFLNQLIGFDASWFTSSENPVTLSDSEPEADCMLVRGDVLSYQASHPSASDVGIVIEVSDSTLGFDRTVKQHLYAENQIPEYWIVNIPDRKIEVYSRPLETGKRRDYRQHMIYVAGDSVPVVLDGEEFGRINVSDILPFD